MMNKQLLNLTYIRKKERNSLVLVIAILLFTSFIDELYLILKSSLARDSVSELKSIPIYQAESLHLDSLNGNQSSDYLSEVYKQDKYRSKGSQSSRQLGVEQRTNYDSEESDPSFIRKSNNHEYDKDESAIKVTEIQESIPISSEIKSISINPNNPNVDDLKALGVPKHVAQTWSKYAAAGGTFSNLEDLEKIYGLEKVQIDKIAENIKFTKIIKPTFNRKIAPIHVNQAGASDFARIRGIGPVLSERIVKFRDKLGGLHSISQFSEVYGVEAELIEENRSVLIIDDDVTKININTCDENELGNHSYCSYRTAKAIINYRQQHGNFTSPANLLEIRIIDNAWLEKITPYLSF